MYLLVAHSLINPLFAFVLSALLPPYYCLPQQPAPDEADMFSGKDSRDT